MLYDLVLDTNDTGFGVARVCQNTETVTKRCGAEEARGSFSTGHHNLLLYRRRVVCVRVRRRHSPALECCDGCSAAGARGPL